MAIKRVDMSKYEDYELVLGDEVIHYKRRRYTGPEVQRALIDASRTVKAENLDSGMTEYFKQLYLMKEIVAEVDGEACSKAFWEEIDGELDYALRLDIFGMPGELMVQTELLKNMMPRPEDVFSKTPSS